MINSELLMTKRIGMVKKKMPNPRLKMRSTLTDSEYWLPYKKRMISSAKRKMMMATGRERMMK